MRTITSFLLSSLLVIPLTGCFRSSTIPEKIDVSSMIRVETPTPSTTVGTTFEVTGEARGNWFFEATFPVMLETEDGTIIHQTYAETNGDWMTEDFVPFRLEVMAPVAEETKAILVLQRANPSDLPENGGELRIPITIMSKNTIEQ